MLHEFYHYVSSIKDPNTYFAQQTKYTQRLDEYNADIYALEIGCKYGITRQDYVDFWGWFTNNITLGDESSIHGLITDRVAYVLENAKQCNTSSN